MTGEEFFAQAPLELDGQSDAEMDAAMGAIIHLYLRATYDEQAGCWPGRDEHDTLRRTCHAVEVTHQLGLDADSAEMARNAGNWLINLPFRDRVGMAERDRSRLYPSRFKTLAYLGRFDDELVRRDFRELLNMEVGGMMRGVTESDVLTTCIVLDTLATLEQDGMRRAICPDDRFEAIINALRQQLRQWRGQSTSAALRPPHTRSTASTARARRRPAIQCEINNVRDLSYAFGLLSDLDARGVSPRQHAAIIAALAACVEQRDRTRVADQAHVMYAALQLAGRRHEDETIQRRVRALLLDVRQSYSAPDASKRWDLSHHTQALRLLLAYYGKPDLAGMIVTRFLREAERRRTNQQGTLETELKHVIRERIEVELQDWGELSGGFTDDKIYRVPFSYWYPMPGVNGDHATSARRGEASVIIKRSTIDAFHTSTEHYRLLPPNLRELFVRQPLEAQVYKSGSSSAYYLAMEDLAGFLTLEQLVNEWDQRAMADHFKNLLRKASELVCQGSFTLFNETKGGRGAFPGTQIARLYLAQIEGKLAKAIARVPWLKNPLDGYYAAEQRFKGLDYYLGVVTKHASMLQPRYLGLTHGDLHARNVMLDRSCAQLKLIDLDKLSWTGDYLADLGNLLTDVCVYRRVAEPQRDFGLPRDEVVFVSKSADTATAENTVRYPALGRPATLAFQEYMQAAIHTFATEIDDATWRPRLWLASATALMTRLSFQTQKEPAAVLYGEAVRLLHELCRHLEQGHELPDRPVPAEWTRAAAATDASGSEVPEWVARQQTLRAVHAGLRALGLRAEPDRGTVSYFAAGDHETPTLKLIPRGREGIGRLLLPTETRIAEDGALKVVRSAQPGDALGTILILTETTAPVEVLRAVEACVASGAMARGGKRGR
ncbi:MAG TPA: phosphotransferase [Ktedonobacterales bacterium]|nr:phosphotransferase [Ktedonobacterales bacterium]